MKMYLKDNVYEAGKKRISRLYDEFDNIIVSISGGKDSTAVLELTLEVAREKNRLPVKVCFIDQEDEWSYTIDYIRYIKSRPEFELYWFQVPVLETSSANHKDQYMCSWDPERKDKWMRQLEPDSIQGDVPEIHKYDDEFKGILDVGPAKYVFNFEKYANIGGVRADESLARFAATTAYCCYKDITWGKKGKYGYSFYPLYDWKKEDVWTYIGKNHLKYNKIYDLMFNYGVSANQMRVSSLHHETAYRSMFMLQELDRDTYDSMCDRLDGVSTFSQLQEQVTPEELPEMFGSWKEYRDYLLVHLIRPDLQSIFTKRWVGQDGDAWYREHVVEVLVNDTVGTKNHNFETKIQMREKINSGKMSFEERYGKYDEPVG